MDNTKLITRARLFTTLVPSQKTVKLLKDVLAALEAAEAELTRRAEVIANAIEVADELFAIADVNYEEDNYDAGVVRAAAEIKTVLAAAPVPLEAVKAETTTEDLREWADYFEHIGSQVGDPQFTQELVVRALRGPRPFGASASTEGDNRV